jgi:leucyl-tRNA synthetase
VGRTAAEVAGKIERLELNTAVAALMKCLNPMSDYRAARGVTPALGRAARDFVRMLAPFAPHIAEELWERLGESVRGSVHSQPWPVGVETAGIEEAVTLVVQVDGRVRDRMEVSADASEDEVRARALARPAVQRALASRPIARIVYVPGRVANIVTG